MAAPSLGGTTLAQPTTYTRDEILQGSIMQMASGLNVTDIVEPGLLSNHRIVYRFSWKLITADELDDISTEYWGMVTAGVITFTDPSSSMMNVQPTKNIGVKVEAIKIGSGDIRYNVSCEWQEYS